MQQLKPLRKIWKREDFEDLSFEEMGLGGCSKKNAKVKNSKFIGCDLANSKWTESFFEKVEFTKCRMTGFRASDSVFRDVVFKDCVIQLSNLRMSKFKDVVFEKYKLIESDFYGSDLGGVKFLDCDLTKA